MSKVVLIYGVIVEMNDYALAIRDECHIVKKYLNCNNNRIYLGKGKFGKLECIYLGNNLIDPPDQRECITRDVLVVGHIAKTFVFSPNTDHGEIPLTEVCDIREEYENKLKGILSTNESLYKLLKSQSVRLRIINVKQ